MSEKKNKPQPKKKSLLKRLVRWLCFFIISSGVILFLTYQHFTSSTYLVNQAQTFISEYIGSEVVIESAEFNYQGKLILSDMKLFVPGMGSGKKACLFEVATVTIQLNRKAMWRGEIQLDDIWFDQPIFYLTEDMDRQILNISLVKTPQPEDTSKPFILPRIIIQRGQYQFGQIQNGVYQPAGSIEATGSLTVGTELGQYLLDVRQLTDATDAGADKKGDGSRYESQVTTLKGWFDPSLGTCQFEMTGLAFRTQYRDLLPSKLIQFWDQYEPTGKIPSVVLTNKQGEGPRLQMKLDEVSLKLPKLTNDDYRFKLHQVSGEVEMLSDRVHVNQLIGKIEDLAYRIDGNIYGYDADAPFEISLKTDPFPVPEKPRYMLALPSDVQDVFRMFTPDGQMRVSMKISRKEKNQPITYQGAATILTGKGQFEKFPYPIENCRGLVMFNHKAIHIRQLTGDTPKGGTITITGSLKPPHKDAEASFTVTAVNLPLDDTLYNAFKPKIRPALDMFFCRPFEKEMLEQGHFITHQQYDQLLDKKKQLEEQLVYLDETDYAQRLQLTVEIAKLTKQLQTPAFTLGGRANVVVHLKRPFGPDKKFIINADVQVQEAEIIFKYFPYPMRVTGGQLIVSEDKELVEFKGIKLEGLHGGVGKLSGTITLPTPDHPEILPAINFVATGVPVDKILFDAIPEPQDQWIRDLHVSGKIDLAGRVFADKSKKIDIALMIDISNTQARPGGGDYLLSNAKGALQISLSRITLDHIVASHGKSRISFNGYADWTDKKINDVDMKIVGSDMRFEESIFDLIKPFTEIDSKVMKVWKTWSPKGLFDAEYTAIKKGEKLTKGVVIYPKNVSFLLDGKRVYLQDTTGKIYLENGNLLFDQFAGHIGQSSFIATGQAIFEPEIKLDLSLKLQGEKLTPQLLQLLPAAVTELTKTLEFKGGFDVDLKKLTWQPDAKEGLMFHLNGEIKLTDAELVLGVPIKKFDSTIKIDMLRNVNDELPQLDLTIQAKRMQILERNVTDLTAKIKSIEGTDLLDIPVIRGRTCGGLIGGSGQLGVNDKSYEFKLIMIDCDLLQLIDKPNSSKIPQGSGAENQIARVKQTTKDKDKDKDKEKLMKGRVSASLNLEGHWNKLEKRRGRGDILIRQAVMYDLPLAMGMLHVANLTLPGSRAFNRAEMNYYLKNNKFYFERISLKSPTLTLDGKGQLDYKTKAIDLTLTSNNPKAWNLGPVSDIITSVKNQLVTIRITGSLDDPKAEVKHFSGITKAIDDVFGGDKKSK